MERVKIEIDLHRARIWQLEAYSSLPAAVLNEPATIDEYDPSTWWTPKIIGPTASTLRGWLA